MLLGIARVGVGLLVACGDMISPLPARWCARHLFSRNKLTDVSALGNVHTLSLYNCRSLSDVSALGNNEWLNLQYCKKIKDGTALATVTHLVPEHVKDLRP